MNGGKFSLRQLGLALLTAAAVAGCINATPATSAPSTSRPSTTARPTTTSKTTTTSVSATAQAGGNVGDRVWIDADRDGVQDKSEAGAGGVPVRAYLIDGNRRRLISSKVSTAGGWFRFFDLAKGDCVALEITIPAGYRITAAHATVENADSDADAAGVTVPHCSAGTEYSDLDIGLVSASAEPTTAVPTTAAPTTTTARPTTTTTTTARPTTTTAPPTTVPPTTVAPSPAGWRLFWSDEFGGSAVDTSKWTVDNNLYLGGNNELECYKPENVTVGAGQLQIEAKRQTVNCGSITQNYTSGSMRTRGKFSTAFGRFEMRAKFPKGKGLWPAFWTTSQNYPYGGGGRSGELDIVEVIGSRPDYVVGTAHWSYNGCGWGCSRYGYEYKMPNGDTADGFHTYAMEWEPGRIAWYFDGIKYYEIGDNSTYKWGSRATQLSKTTDYNSNPLASYPAPFDASNPQQMILNLAVGGNWPGAPDSTTAFPAKMLVDYVRVYKR